ncbi:MAG: phage protease [Methyloprofundus sp.]|nr:phage protease [Methyloprofundus sp.]
MKTKTPLNSVLAACLFPLAAQSNDIQLFPAGQFDAPDGALAGKGPWLLNAELAAHLIAAAKAKQNMLIDYDHQSLLFTKNLEPLESAGTFAGAGLEWREGLGLFATNVQWTAASKAHFAVNKYRYISPLFTYDSQSGAVTRLISVALTDNPAIKNMQAIELAAASFLTSQPKENSMRQQLLALFGLAHGVDDATLLAACAEAKQGHEQALEQIKILSAEKDALAATSTQEPDAAKYVPIAAVLELQQQLAALSGGIETDRVTKLINDNKVKLPTPGLQAWAAKQSFAALSAYLETAPEIAALSGMQSTGNQPTDSVHRNDVQSLLAAANKYQAEQKALGFDVDDIAALSHARGASHV